jgi:hypothetical protein
MYKFWHWTLVMLYDGEDSDGDEWLAFVDSGDKHFRQTWITDQET